MKEYFLKTDWDTIVNVAPVIRRYSDNNVLAIELIHIDTGECFDFLTVNLNDSLSDVTDNTLSFVNTNHCSNYLSFIEDNNLGKATGFMGFSGYCIYPEVKFDLSMLNTEDDINNYFVNGGK